MIAESFYNSIDPWILIGLGMILLGIALVLPKIQNFVFKTVVELKKNEREGFKNEILSEKVADISQKKSDFLTSQQVANSFDAYIREKYTDQITLGGNFEKTHNTSPYSSRYKPLHKRKRLDYLYDFRYNRKLKVAAVLIVFLIATLFVNFFCHG